MSSRMMGDELPQGWCSTTVGDLLEPFENANPAQSGRTTFRYVDIEAIDNSRHEITNAKELSTKNAPSRARKVIRQGDVLISLVRPYLQNIAIVPEALDNQWASTAFCVCRPRKGIDSRFLYYMFLRKDFIDALPTYGDSPPAAHDDDLLATAIALPPKEEITRIVDRLDELFTDLSAGVTALERVKRKLSRYRAAVLHAAVTGRLTEDWRKKHGPAEEPGPKLLERILIERRRQWEQRTLQQYEQKGKTPPKNWRGRYPNRWPQNLRKWYWTDYLRDGVMQGLSNWHIRSSMEPLRKQMTTHLASLYYAWEILPQKVQLTSLILNFCRKTTLSFLN